MLLNLVAPLDSAVPPLEFEQINVFLTSGFDSFSIVFDSLSVSRSLPEFCVTSFWFYHHRLWWSSWHAMLALSLFYVFLVWIFSWRDLFQVTRTDASCVLHIICSYFRTFEQVTLYSAYCAWFVALLASSFGVLLRTCHYLFLAQFDSSAYIRIQFELQWPVQS